MGNTLNSDPNTGVTETVTINFKTGTNDEGANLFGTTTASIDWTTGQANFTDLSVNLVGSYQLTVMTSLGGFGTDSSAFNITAAPASPAASLITAVPISITASSSTITVQLKDSVGNNIAAGGDSVTLSTMLGTLSAVTDNGNGTYTATLTSATTTGTATISGTVNGLAITDSATVDFIAGAATKLAFSVQAVAPT